MKKVKMIQIQDLEPECPKCKGSNAMLNAHQNRLKCRDCSFLVEEKDIEIELITMQEGQERLRKYGSLFPWKKETQRQIENRTLRHAFTGFRRVSKKREGESNEEHHDRVIPEGKTVVTITPESYCYACSMGLDILGYCDEDETCLNCFDVAEGR